VEVIAQTLNIHNQQISRNVKTVTQKTTNTVVAAIHLVNKLRHKNK